MREVASDVLVHHGPVALANLIADGSAPVVSNQVNPANVELVQNGDDIRHQTVEAEVGDRRRLVIAIVSIPASLGCMCAA